MAKESNISERPLGVTIISILGFIGAGLLVLAGIAMLGFGGMMGSLGMMGGLLGGVGAMMGIVLLASGILLFAVYYGLWNMKRWAWIVTMVLEGLGLLSGLASMSISLVVPAIILWYLWTKKDLFK